MSNLNGVLRENSKYDFEKRIWFDCYWWVISIHPPLGDF
jgi:hypothetical protein